MICEEYEMRWEEQKKNLVAGSFFSLHLRMKQTFFFRWPKVPTTIDAGDQTSHLGPKYLRKPPFWKR